MSKQWAKQELKHDPLAGSVGRLSAWIEANRRNFLIGLGALLAVLVAGGVLARNWINRKNEAWERLSLAQSYAFRGDNDASLAQIKSLTENFDLNEAAAFGLLFAADLHYRQARYKEAADAYQKIVEAQRPKRLVPVALANMGLALEAGGDYKAAADSDQRFLDAFQDHFLAPQTHAALARCLEALGQKEQARTALQRISLLYPDTYWAQWSQARLKS